MINWDDLKYFLAVAEAGSFSAASKKILVSQPTLSRHLLSLEEAIGGDLFLRASSGLELTPLGERLVEHVEHMQNNVHTIERLAAGHDTNLDGTVVISSVETIGAEWLVKHTRPFHDKYPNLTVNFKITHESTDLLRREADIALRLFRPAQGDLITKKTVKMNFGYYASKDYIARHGMPKQFSDLRQHHRILPYDTIIAATAKHMQQPTRPNIKASFRSNNFIALSAAVREGFGIGSYACFLAKDEPNLVRIFEDINMFSADIWLVSHSDLRKSARIRAMYDYLGDILHAHAKDFAGTV